MSGDILSTQNFSVRFGEVNWPTFVNGLSYIAIENSILFPPTVTNIKFEKAVKLPGVCYSSELSQKGTSLVDRDHGYPMAKKFNSRNLR